MISIAASRFERNLHDHLGRRFRRVAAFAVDESDFGQIQAYVDPDEYNLTRLVQSLKYAVLHQRSAMLTAP